jgi:hypothetical protein
MGYRLSLMRLLIMGLLFSGGIELLQVPLPTDFVIDCFGSWLGIGLIWIGGELSSRGGFALSMRRPRKVES